MSWIDLKAKIHDVVACTLGNKAAAVYSVGEEPFTFSEGDTLTAMVDGEAFSYTFIEEQGEPIANLTAIQVAAVFGVIAEDWDTKVRLVSNKYCGKDSNIQVTGGDANDVLQFPLTLSEGDGLSDSMVVWANEAQPYILSDNSGKVTLEVIADRGLGQVEIKHTSDDDGAILTSVQSRIVTISVQAECLSNEDEFFAFRWLTDCQSHLSRRVAVELLAAANMAVIDIGDIVRLPSSKVDQRVYSKANFDLDLAYVDERIDTSFDGGWIETVEVDSPFYDKTLVIP